jgi:hypothetical protein
MRCGACGGLPRSVGRRRRTAAARAMHDAGAAQQLSLRPCPLGAAAPRSCTSRAAVLSAAPGCALHGKQPWGVHDPDRLRRKPRCPLWHGRGALDSAASSPPTAGAWALRRAFDKVISGAVGAAAPPRRGTVAPPPFQRNDIADTLERAIKNGAPTYNRGDHGACAAQQPRRAKAGNTARFGTALPATDGPHLRAGSVLRRSSVSPWAFRTWCVARAAGCYRIYTDTAQQLLDSPVVGGDCAKVLRYGEGPSLGVRTAMPADAPRC